MAQIDNLPPLRDILRKHDLIAKKSLGQNFLLDLNLTLKIAKSAGNLENVHVIEVGPGPGGLTRAILAAGAKHVTVIERDSRCLEALREISAHYPGRMTIIEDDALKVDMASLIPAGSEAKIIANLPYNVATPLLIGWLRQEPWPPFYSSLTLMFQKEVADRICARASDKQYGRLAVLSSWRTYATSLFDLDPRNFTPPPKVTSSVVHLEPRKAPLPCNPDVLEQVTAAAFQQRRKMLRASLKSLGVDTAALIEAAELSPEQRAETVPMEGFVALANALASIRSPS